MFIRISWDCTPHGLGTWCFKAERSIKGGRAWNEYPWPHPLRPSCLDLTNSPKMKSPVETQWKLQRRGQAILRRTHSGHPNIEAPLG